jgi:FkbM family methyltransferase
MKTFVEIGTCDFDTLRPLCDSGWRGIMVEPYQPFLDNIEDHDNLIKVNNAVGLYDGTTSYRKVKQELVEKLVDESYKGMGTITSITPFDTSNDYIDKLEEHQVSVITFDTLMTTLDITEIDYLKIDTEGMDFDILKSIDYIKYKINVIKMEHSYCDEKLVIDFLINNGYHCELFIDDIIAIKK